MRGEIEKLHAVAGEQHFLVSLGQVVECGLNEKYAERQADSGRWIRRHDGVYQVDVRPLDRRGELMAAVLAAGPAALVSHRAAIVLWGLDGIRTAPPELTVPFNNHPIPEGVIVHRTRRGREAAVRERIPVCTAERTLLDAAGCLPRMVVAKALDSALRLGHTTVERTWETLTREGGRGVRGTRALRWVLQERRHDTATDSGSEVELLYHMQMAMLPRPELDHELFSDGRRMVPDFYWPNLGKAIEVDGVDAHSSADQLDDDLVRQNLLLDLGIELRRFSARRIRREPAAVVAEIRHFLES
jgi:hypothetical protein